MSLEVKVHDAQTHILRELLFVPSAGYALLQKSTGLASDHFNFHIKRLVEQGLVEKAGRGQYRLSDKGKVYANKLDTDERTIERQPKISVILVVTRDNEVGQRQLLMQERLKNPYFGFWGYPTGKVKWGETVLQTAERELLEETGLSGTFTFHGIYHEHAYKADGAEMLEDKIFLITSAHNPSGELVDIQGCHNEWVSFEVARNFEKSFPGFETVQDLIYGKKILAESDRRYQTEHF